MEGAAKAYLLDTGTIGKPYKAALDQDLKTLEDFRAWEWFVGGSSHTVQKQIMVYEVASKLMERLFRDTPPHTLANHFKPGSPSPSLKKAVESIIKGNVQIAKTSKGAMETIVRACGSSFGVLKHDRTEGAYDIYMVHEPGASFPESGNVWRLIHDSLVARKSWSTIVATLRKPPYGLYDSLLLVYLAAFLTSHADSIEWSHNKAVSGRPGIDLTLLDNMLSQPQNYTLKFQPLNEAERRWIRGIVEHGLKKSPISTMTQGKSLRTTVADQVQAWVKHLKLPRFVEQLSLETIREIMPESSPDTLSAALMLIQRKDDLASVLMDDLPQAVGAPPDHTQWDEEQANNLIASFAEVCPTLQELPRNLRLYAENRIATLFACEDLPASQQWNAIYDWRQKKQIVKPDRLSTPARTLFRLTNDPNGSI